MAKLLWAGRSGRYHAKGRAIDYYIERSGGHRPWTLVEFDGQDYRMVDTFITLSRARAHAAYREGRPRPAGING